MIKNSKSRSLLTIPENTGLNLICDNRSGARLEIVIPVLNEEKRIGNILHYYKGFDIVFLDGGSNDMTIEMAIQRGATVYSRVGDAVGENHFTYYVNTMSKSGYCFYMMADEFIKKEDLLDALPKLQQRRCVIFGRKIEWLYGVRVNRPPSIMPRGICRGGAMYDSEKLHDSLRCPKEIEEIYIDIHHLHVWSMKYFLGQAGKYAHIEVEQFMRSDRPIWRFIRRFFVSEVLMLPRKLWNQRNASLAILLFMILVGMTMPLIGLLCFIEQRFLLSPEKQLELYAKFYKDN